MASSAKIKHFLLIYDRANGRQVDLMDFGTDGDGAVAKYQELEKAYASNPRMDIVLVGSDSLESVKVTHASYFAEGQQDLEAYLRAFSVGRASLLPSAPQ